jgi:hypothetical protein
MTARSPISASTHVRRRRQAALLIVAIVAVAALVIIAVIATPFAAAGWLIGFFYLSAVPAGSLALLMIHRLTGGRWGDSIRSTIEPAANCIPLIGLLFIPVLVAQPVLFPWFAGSAQVKPDVGHLYLNGWLFSARAIIAFIGWSALALILPRLSGRAGVLWAGIGLMFYAVSISLVSIDWVLSAEPVFISTSFGASIAFMQLQAALAFAALFAPELDEQPRRDIGGLMLTVTLGLTYIDFMALLVIWYGNLPHKVNFFVARDVAPWTYVAVAAFILSSVLPVLALLLSRVRGNRMALRWVSGSILCGLACYDAWLLAPPHGVWTLGTGALAVIGLACAFVALMGTSWPGSLLHHAGPARRAAHE